MNVSLTKQDAVSGIMKIEIVKADYAELVEKNLRGLRQKANIPGFRKGMVPMGMVQKMYGKHVLAEEVNKLVSENIYKYIRENNVNVLGEPMPSETDQPMIDFNKDETFEFVFDVALAPEIDINLTKRDKVPFYQVTIDDKMVDEQVESYKANFGTYTQVTDVEETDMLKGRVAELENGTLKEGGIVVEDAVVMPKYMKDEAEKAKFMTAGLNSIVIFNPNKAYEGAEAEISSFLKIDKSQVANVTADFSFEVQEITRYAAAEVDQTLFDRVFGPDAVSTEDEFRAKIRVVLAEQFTPQSNYKFMLDSRDMLMKKAGDLQFADELLKRWLLVANENNTKEAVEEDFPKVKEDLTYHLIKENLVKGNDLKVEDADVVNVAKQVAKSQFAQYGMLSVPDDVLTNYAQDMLKNKETIQNLVDRAVEDKLAEWLKEHVKLDVKEVSVEEFGNLFK